LDGTFTYDQLQNEITMKDVEMTLAAKEIRDRLTQAFEKIESGKK
jgi:hypothetical protein